VISIYTLWFKYTTRTPHLKRKHI